MIDFPKILEGLLPFLTLFFGLSAGLTATPAELKWKMLSFDRDGWRIFLIGAMAVVVGLFMPDYTARKILTLGGTLVASLGFWIGVPDRITNGWLGNGLAFPFYLLAFAFSAYYGSQGKLLAPDLVSHYLDRLVLPAAAAALLFVLSLLSFASTHFKEGVLKLDSKGSVLAGYGLLPLVLTMCVGPNPALVITMAVLGAGLVSLGGLIALPDKVTNDLLKPIMAVSYGSLMFMILYWSRAAF